MNSPWLQYTYPTSNLAINFYQVKKPQGKLYPDGIFESFTADLVPCLSGGIGRSVLLVFRLPSWKPSRPFVVCKAVSRETASEGSGYRASVADSTYQHHQTLSMDIYRYFVSNRSLVRHQCSVSVSIASTKYASTL